MEDLPHEAADVSVETADSNEAPESVCDTEQATNISPVDSAYYIRLQRIMDYRAGAQGEPDPLRASVIGMNSDLLDFQLNLGEALRQALATTGMSLADFERLLPHHDLMMRLIKQAAQITQLELRMRKDNAATTAANSQRHTEAKKTLPCAPTQNVSQAAE